MNGKTDGDANATAAPEKISKQEAVRMSLAKLGTSAMPQAIQTDIKDSFNLDVSKNYISSIKAEVLEGVPPKKASKKMAKKKPDSSAAVALPAEAPAATEADGEEAQAITLDDVLAIKGLIDRVGPENLRTIIEAFSG